MPTTRRRREHGFRRRITPEAVEAFRRRDYVALHDALGLKPWEWWSDLVAPKPDLSALPPEAVELRTELERLAR